MVISKQKTRGATLVETMWVIVIMGAIVIMGWRSYNAFQADTDAQQLRANVEGIIRGAAYYYYGNCDINSNSAATLDPANFGNPDPTTPANKLTPYTGETLTKLVTSGLVPKYPPTNRYVDTSGGDQGYIVQFNPSYTYYQCVTTGQNLAISAVWRIEVAVKIDPTKADQLLAQTGADCLTSSNGSNQVVTCANASGYVTTCQTAFKNNDQTTITNNNCPTTNRPTDYNNYLAWERLPSMASPKGQSNLWMSNTQVKNMRRYYEIGKCGDNVNGSYFKCGS